MSMLSRISAFFGWEDEDGLSVPPLDGILKPNNLLETAEPVCALTGIDSIALAGGHLHCASGRQLFRLDPATGDANPVAGFDGAVTALASAWSGSLVVATDGAGLWLVTAGGDVRRLPVRGREFTCVTACLAEDDDTLLLAVGSLHHPLSDWKRDLMSHGASGQVIRYTITTGASAIVRDGLAFPHGLARLADGDIAISESWRHRIVSLAAGTPKPLLGELPAYPGRIAPSSDGGFWLALFAPRRQLTELVLRDDDYRLDMMATIPPEAWIGPDFAAGGDGTEPLQAGSVRQMGIMKPWAPSRSYGLVVRLDSNLRPVASYHSRADGKMHGIVSVVETGGALYAASRGAGMLLRLDVSPGLPK